MTYEQALEYIHGFEKFGWVLGLERIAELLKRLGNPQDKLRFVHIAGTNGKGSTTVMCTEILRHSGYKCGMYTSPFVVDFRERFQINGEMITKEAFAEYTSRVRSEIEILRDENVQITEFEAITAIGFLWFYEQKCDIVCLEVGLGGNYDATNVIKTPLVAAVMSISLDHVNILGDNIRKIAGEKAGIIKENGICVCYPKQNIDALTVLLARCAGTNSRFFKANEAAVRIIKSDVSGSDFEYDGHRYNVSLVGEHQVFNAVTVIDIMKQLTLQGFTIPQEAVEYGIANAAFPARFEILSDRPRVVLDGAHNPEGTEALSVTLQKVNAPRKFAMMGMLADKDYETSVKNIASVVDKVYCIPVPNPRALDSTKLCECALKYCKFATAFADSDKALREAMVELNDDDFLIICGSLYMASDMRKKFIHE